MAKIALISCVSKKTNKLSKVKELYVSPLFKYNLKYAHSLNPDKIFVLSAEYGLLEPEQEIEPYNKTLNKMPDGEVRAWAGKVLEALRKKTNLEEDEFIFLAGEKYRKYILPHIKNYKVPMKNLSIGRQLKFLKEKTKGINV